MKNSHLFTAAAYIRVSTEDQIEFSPDSQRKKILEYADRNHISLPEQFIYVDEGISGRNADNRPAFLEMIRTAKTKPKPFDQILVWKFSRFARNRQDSIFYKSMLRKECGIDVISITEQLSDDPTSILIEALLEAMDEYYSINLAQEVRRGMNEKFSRGGIVTSPPFGYRMGKERYVPDNRTAPVIPMIFDDYLSGMSCRQIAKKLNHMNILTIRGNPFEARNVRYILGNPVYLGMQRRHLSPRSSEKPVTVVPSLHAALVSRETFLAAQNRLRLSQKSPQRSARSKSGAFLFQGLIRCSCCGSTLTRNGNTLQCCRYTRGQCPVSHSISLNKIRNVIFEKIREDFSYFPEHKIRITPSVQEQKKSRKSIPALSKTIFFSDLPFLLQNPLLTDEAKNTILHSLISGITFSRPENTIRIDYQI